MCCGAWKEYLIVRVGADFYADALAEPYAKEFDITGRPMNGWVMVAPEGVAADDDLKEWLDRGVCFAQSLPKKA